MLPSTTALRIFEAVARHGSCSGAASEVCLTQSAVSKQVKSLEQLLNCELFIRSPRGLILTEAGSAYRHHVCDALSELETAALSIARLRDAPQSIRLHVLPILGDRWLMPRFPAFADKHPDIDVQFTSFTSAEDSEEPDAMFRFGEGVWPGYMADYLFGREIVLVASQGFLTKSGAIENAADVTRYTLLQHFQTPAIWNEFAQSNGLRSETPARITRYGFFGVMIRAAVAGMGVALIPQAFVAEELASGQLVNPAGLSFKSRTGYYLALPENRPPRAGLIAFREWLLQEASSLRSVL
jgi:LysR family transcriptional regulator, glycine cleavage system transcriptional activator